MKTKEFDAVAMKDRCQDHVRREFEGLTEEERRERVEDWLAVGEDPMARVWRRIQKPSATGETPPSSVKPD